MKRFVRNLIPVIIFGAFFICMAILGLAGSVLAAIGKAVTGFFVNHLDYAIIIIVTSIITSMICTFLQERENKKEDNNEASSAPLRPVRNSRRNNTVDEFE